MEMLYWRQWEERQAKAVPFGRTVLSIDDLLHFIATKNIFWAAI
ncbi:MAG: hypothetical protein P4L90_04310 [Rhodopila sp.]|nr:hypothetical protein [Rhodopila sp.]